MMKLTQAYLSDNINKQNGLVKTTVFAGNGIFEKHKGWMGKVVKKVNDYSIGGYPDMEESIELTTDDLPKIPAKAILYVIKWYKDITHKNGQEAQINFYRLKNNQKTIKVNNKDINIKDIPTVKFWSDEIFSYVPKQDNSGAQTSTHNSEEYYDELNKQIGAYVETHSHNSMTAFRSGTDEKYSYNDGVQLVFGKLNTDTPEMYTWATVRGVQKAGLSFEEVNVFVELPTEYITYNTQNKFDYDLTVAFSEVDFEENLFEEWNKQIVVPVYTYTHKYNNNYIWNNRKNNKHNNYYHSNSYDYSDYYQDYNAWYDNSGTESINDHYSNFYTTTTSYTEKYDVDTKLKAVKEIVVPTVINVMDIADDEYLVSLLDTLVDVYSMGIKVKSPTYLYDDVEELADTMATDLCEIIDQYIDDEDGDDDE